MEVFTHFLFVGWVRAPSLLPDISLISANAIFNEAANRKVGQRRKTTNNKAPAKAESFTFNQSPGVFCHLKDTKIAVRGDFFVNGESARERV